ncbi:MAG: DUF4854 domain-containing protein [Lachnospiraceae bacterium]|nr:DUF4854 domain-containing protein [Lachnospiraceae bacterium]
MKKRLLALVLVAVMILSLTACGSKSMTLDEWMQSDEAKLTEEMTNSQLASSGITVKLAADGNTFVYEYTMPGEGYEDLSTEDLAAAFDPVIEQNKSGLEDLFKTFDSEYDIKLDGARFVFLTADGTEIYSGDVANE